MFCDPRNVGGPLRPHRRDQLQHLFSRPSGVVLGAHFKANRGQVHSCRWEGILIVAVHNEIITDSGIRWPTNCMISKCVLHPDRL